MSVASTSRRLSGRRFRWFSVRDTYVVDVPAGQDDLLILASVLALDLAEDRERERH